MLVKLQEVDFTFKDQRGTLTQLVHDGWKQVNVITSTACSVRGGHYHRLNDEAFYIISGKLKLELQYGDAFESHVFQTGDMFLIRKSILHSFEFMEETVLVSFYDKGVELPDGTKDIYTNKSIDKEEK